MDPEIKRQPAAGWMVALRVENWYNITAVAVTLLSPVRRDVVPAFDKLSAGLAFQ